MKKIGVMGGTFDPIHIGHLLLGQIAYESFGLDEVWFLPNGNPPHKEAEINEIDLDHRVHMVELAIENVPHFRLCLHEAKIKKHSYTFETMRTFNKMYPEVQFYFILGADSLFSIEKWAHFREIFPICIILAAMRDDKDQEEMKKQIEYLHEKYGAKIQLLRAPLLEISSTTIRDRAAHNLSVHYMVPEAVADFITRNQLYRESRKDQ